MSFPETTKCQSCGNKATVIIEYYGTVKETYCNDCFEKSRAGFNRKEHDEIPVFVFLDKEGNPVK